MATPRKISAKRNPLFIGQQALSFDDISQEELLELTPTQASEKFLSQWMNTFHPYSTYPRVFNSKFPKEAERHFHDIKLHFIKRVVESDWSEKKFVMVINTLMENRAMVNSFTLDKFGRMFEEGTLPIQERIRREGRRNND